MRAHPVSLGYAAVVLVIAVTVVITGTDDSMWGAGPLSTFAASRWWTPLTAVIVPDSITDAVLSVILAVTVLAYAERLLGSIRTAVLLPLLGVAGVLVGVAAHALAWTLTDLRPVVADEVPVLDPAIAMVGTIMAASAFAPALWRRRLRLVGFALLGMFALYGGDADAWYRVAAAVIGLVVGVVLARRPRIHWHRSSARETRTLLALLLSVSALGPLIALVTGGGRGPLSLVVDAFSQYDEALLQRCQTVDLPICDEQVTFFLTRGVGPALLAVTPLALLLVAAWGLRIGRRSAWMLAIGVQTVLVVLAVVSWATGRLVIDPWIDGSGAEYLLWAAASIGVPAALVVALVVLRRRFTIRATSRAVKQTAITVGAAFVVCASVLFTVESIGRQAFDGNVSVLDLLLLTLRRFVPPVFLQPAGHAPFPHRGAALFAYQWVGVAFWVVVILGMLWLFRHPRRPVGEDGTLYRTLLTRGSDTLDFLGTWRGNTYWYSAERDAAVAYRVVGGVALALADPLAEPERRAAVADQFVDFCGEHGWTVAFYSVHDETMDVLRARGWHAIPVGVETVLDLVGLDFSGKAWQKVRQPLTRAEREGFTAVWSRWHDLTVAQAAQVTAIDEEWVADRALPEMGFTLGGLDELRDPDVRLLLAIGPGGRIEAVTSWMPSWTDGRISGWTLDYMRRRGDGPNGMMEFLIASAALRLRDEGAGVLSLSGAPLASDPTEEDAPPTALREFLRFLAGALEPAYGFASLFRFKSKFRPRYRQLLLAYRDGLDLPAIGAAVGRAYLPDASRAELVAVARSALSGRR